ncbi:toprim domain-containing protein [Methylobacterium sp. J-078]|uniref:DUF7146 domain-containing protein n=1 Tax=Methylobacterium sp. J-078 TaxID=2836657 RepID=UPI001FBAA2B7|nr:toprim domain-containing protein [Methylobacterium sp. J-078]MCJ2044740.1 toprim domain-containing protein [Methylobacterium sp. J-078]
MTDLRTMARDLGGEVAGIGQIVCPGPGHSHRDRSLSVRLDARAPGGIVVYSFAGDDALAAKDYVRQRLGLSEIFARSGANLPRRDERKVAPVEVPGSGERTARAMAIWSEARHPAGSPVESYLGRRGVSLPDDPREVIRFHPACPFAGTRTRAMVALVRDIVTNEPVAIHRTALSLDGQKIEVNGHDRLALGPIGGGAVKLTPDEGVTTCLGIGEGIETTLSLRRSTEFGESPVWSLLAAGGISTLPVLPGIEALWIATDHDPAGLKASRSCATRWQSAGAETFLITPDAPGADLNDLLTGAHHV